MFLKISQNLQKNTNTGVSLQAPCVNLYLKKTLVQLFFFDFCEIFKNIFFTESLQVTTSGSPESLPKTYQIDINWGNDSDFNYNTERIIVCCDSFRNRHPR